MRSHFATLGLLAGVVLSSSGSTAAQEDEAPIIVPPAGEANEGGLAITH